MEATEPHSPSTARRQPGGARWSLTRKGRPWPLWWRRQGPDLERLSLSTIAAFIALIEQSRARYRAAGTHRDASG